jgi:hypothetical protein
MSKFVALSIDRDDRIQSYCVTAKCSYLNFLQLTTGAESNLNIQRGIIKGSKAYATLRADLRRGCILPPIVLAANCKLTAPIEKLFEAQDIGQISKDLALLESNDVYVIDGLQRTNAIRQTLEEIPIDDRPSFLARFLRVELWLNIPFGAIAYRMLLLNAGQRPMSVKHQVELLSSKLVDELVDIPNLIISRIKDAQKRTKPGQFALAKVALGFQAWLQGQHNLDLRNTVMEELLADSAIEILGKTVPPDSSRTREADGFHRLMNWMVELDFALGDENVAFLGNETVILGIAAAIGAMERNPTLAPRVWPSLNSLLTTAKLNSTDDVVGVKSFEILRKGIDSQKVNVGVATRDMVCNTFKEYIRGAGDTPMADCWQIGAANL